ncbi:MAG: amidase [Veillonellaceae bacterium]|nr:amidase [Veillonellaceae bacterium]
MNAINIESLTLKSASDLIRSRALSPVELVQACLDRIEAVDGQVKAWVVVLAEQAMAQAKQAEQEIRSGHYRGPLHGIPYGAKDIIHVAGVPTTGGSQVEPEYVPAKNAAIIDNLTAAGAIFLGKTTTTEFAFLGGEPATRNPWNLEHTPGGSSSGSAAAVAASMALFALGTQTIGSLLRPASFNGLTCIKSTYGLVSRRGVIPASWSLDHLGAFTHTVEDTAIVLSAIAGHDPQDPGSLTTKIPDYADTLTISLTGKIIGLPTSFFRADDTAITYCVERAVKVMETLGMHVRPVAMPDCLPEAVASLPIVMRAEAAAYHQTQYAQTPERFGPYIREQIALGRQTLAVDYLQAQRIRTVFRNELLKVFADVDLLLTPSTLTVAPKGYQTGNPIFNGPFTNAGLPAMTIPVGFEAATGLPVGMQLVGPLLAESLLLAAGSEYQRITNWHEQRPKFRG